MPNNAFLNFDTLPRFADIHPKDADAAVDAVLDNLQKAADNAAAAPPNWENTMRQLEDAQESVSRVWCQIEHMHAVDSTEPWRDAHRRNHEKIAAAYARLGQHAGVYAKLRELTNSPDAAQLTPARQKILQDALRDFELSGVALPEKQKAQFRQNAERAAAIAAKFEENLLDATADNPLLVDDESMLGDMPEDQKQSAKQANGSFKFTLMQPSFAAFMQYSPARDKRQTMYYHYHTRASEFGPPTRDNSPLIKELLSLRAEQAALLKCKSYAHLAFKNRMAESPTQILQFIRDLAVRATPAAKRELQEMRDFAAAQFGLTDLQPWDAAFIADQLRRQKFDFSEGELRPYLQAAKVMEGLFSCVQLLFAANFKEEKASLPPGAQFLRMRDEQSRQPLGGLYVDLYARKTKRGGAWMADVLSRCLRGGKLQLPAAHVVCNFTAPMITDADSEKSPPLLNWDEVPVLFHEFGHALHHLLTRADDYSASGMNGVEWDAVELPSQFLENFVWDWRVLAPMTAHIKTGAPLPRELFDKMLAARRFQSGLRLLRQLEFALFDMLLHTEKPRPFMEVLNEVRQELSVWQTPEWNRFPCGFSHIFAGGYAAGYYGYLWAETLSADMFAMFEESGDVLNPELGRRFRDEVLAAGGARSAIESFVAARGRKPDSAALLKHYGLTA